MQTLYIYTHKITTHKILIFVKFDLDNPETYIKT